MEDLASDDVFVEINDINQTSSSHYNPNHLSVIRTYWYFFEKIAYFIIGIANIAANLFLIFIILRFKRLRNRTNYYLMNIAITNTIYHAFSPLLFIILEAIPNVQDSYVTFCYIFLVDETGCFTMYLFASILAVDWYILNYKETFIHIHDRLYRYAIAIVYFIGITRYVIISLTYCTFNKGAVHHFLYVTYIISTIIVVVVNILRIRHSDVIESTKTRYALIAANVIIISWIPLFLYNMLLMIDISSNIVSGILINTMIIPVSIAHSNTMVLLYILGRVNKNFKKAYNRAFRIKVTDYELDELDIDSEDEAVAEHHVHVEPEALNIDAVKTLVF